MKTFIVIGAFVLLASMAVFAFQQEDRAADSVAAAFVQARDAAHQPEEAIPTPSVAIDLPLKILLEHEFHVNPTKGKSKSHKKTPRLLVSRRACLRRL
jgi:hypothetical protein